MYDVETFCIDYISFTFIYTPGANHRSAKVLFLLVIPGQLMFLYTIHLMEGAHTVPTPFFVFIFLVVALIQVSRSCSPGPGKLPVLTTHIDIRLFSVVLHVTPPPPPPNTPQVYSLLCVADWMVPWLWQRGKDPDSYSIPYLTALGDLLGTALLSLAFLLFWWTGEPISTSCEWFGRI